MGGTAHTTEEIIDALKATNGLISLAAKRLGCSPQAIYLRRRGSVAIQQAIKDARSEIIDHAELALRAAVLSQQPWAVALVLKTIGKDRGYTERTELTGADGGPVRIDVSELSDDELERIANGDAAGASKRRERAAQT